MAVGTGTIKLSEVCTEIDGVQTSLLDCINDAVAGNYDGTYYTAPATSLAEFRGYTTAVTVYAVDLQMNKTGVASIAVCSATVDWTHYVNHSSGQPANGRILSNSVGTPITGGDFWFRYGLSKMQVSNSGVISNFGSCF